MSLRGRIAALAGLLALTSLLTTVPAVASAGSDSAPTRQPIAKGAAELLSEAARISYDLSEPGPGKAWVLVAEEVAADTVQDSSGKTMATHGVRSEFSLVDVPKSEIEIRTSDDLVAAAGCSVTRYVSYPYRAYYAAGKYAVNAYTRLTNGSGCPYNEYVYARLREEQGWSQPTVDDGSMTIPPGNTRTLYLLYPCGSGRHKYIHQSEGYYFTSSSYLCP